MRGFIGWLVGVQYCAGEFHRFQSFFELQAILTHVEVAAVKLRPLANIAMNISEAFDSQAWVPRVSAAFYGLSSSVISTLLTRSSEKSPSLQSHEEGLSIRVALATCTGGIF